MHRLYISLILLIFLGFQECNQGKVFVFSESISLNGKEVEIDEILNPSGLYIYDSLLVIREKPRNKNALKVLDLKDFSIVSEAVFLGRGPGELVNPGPIIIDEVNKDMWISDWSKFKCFKFPIDSILSNKHFKPSESFDINRGLMPMLNSFYYSTGCIGFSSYNLRRKCLISFIDYNGNIIDSLTIPKKSLPTIWDNVRSNDNPYLINYNSRHNKFIIANRYRNEITIIDDHGNLCLKINALTRKKTPSRKGSFTSDYTSYYKIFSDEDYIYCLFVGESYASYDNTLKRYVGNHPKRILVFDWDGNGKYDIELDHRLVKIAFDYNRRRIIGLAKDYYNGFVMYDLSRLGN